MNHLHYGDNLQVLRDSIASESVDLVYLNPPFNSNASYNVLFKGPSGNTRKTQDPGIRLRKNNVTDGGFIMALH